jgi:basic membrane protein A
VLGWDTAKNDGLFTGNFDSTDDGKKFATNLMQEGADIIMPVAGPVGLGSAAVCQQTKKCWIVGVDTDWTVSASEYKDVVLTSVMKNMNVAVYDTIKAVKDGSFKGGVYVGTLENNGVGLAAVTGASADLMKELDQVKADIISGKITIK